MASATADDAAKGSPSGKGTAGHHEAGKVRKDMVARSVDRNMLAVTHSFRDSKAYARVMILIVATARVPICSLSLKGTRLGALKDLGGTGLMSA